MAWSVCVVGSVALDSVETPSGNAPDILGGSASYFAVAASFLAPVRMVAVTGSDFPAGEREFLASRGIDLDGLVEVGVGKRREVDVEVCLLGVWVEPEPKRQGF